VAELPLGLNAAIEILEKQVDITYQKMTSLRMDYENMFFEYASATARLDELIAERDRILARYAKP